MSSLILGKLRQCSRSLLAGDSSRQVAFGITLGAMAGIMPKDNLTATLLTMTLLGTRCNLAAGLVSMGLFSIVGQLADPLSHQLGLLLLTAPTLNPFWNGLFSVPLLPWTGLNNTVVLGSLLVGCALACPVFYVSLVLLDRYRTIIAQKLLEYRVARLLLGADVLNTWVKA